MNRFDRNALISLTLLAFLLSAVVPFYATYAAPASAVTQPTDSSPFGDKILLCTANGFSWVSIADLKDGKAPQPDPGYKCPLCYLAGKGIALSSTQMEPGHWLFVQRYREPVRYIVQRHSLHPPFWTVPSGRAPPVSA